MLPRFHIKLSLTFMPVACDYFNFIWIVIFYAAFSSPEMTIYERSKISWLIFFSTFDIWNIVCFHSLKINVKSSIHMQLFPKWGVCVCVKLFFRLYIANTFTDCGINTKGVSYPIWAKPLVLLVLLWNTRQEANVQSLCIKA